MITHKQDALYHLAGIEARIASTRKQLDADNPRSVEIANSILPGLVQKADGLRALAAALPLRERVHTPSAARWVPVVVDPLDPGFDIPPFLQRRRSLG